MMMGINLLLVILWKLQWKNGNQILMKEITSMDELQDGSLSGHLSEGVVERG